MVLVRFDSEQGSCKHLYEVTNLADHLQIEPFDITGNFRRRNPDSVGAAEDANAALRRLRRSTRLSEAGRHVRNWCNSVGSDDESANYGDAIDKVRHFGLSNYDQVSGTLNNEAYIIFKGQVQQAVVAYLARASRAHGMRRAQNLRNERDAERARFAQLCRRAADLVDAGDDLGVADLGIELAMMAE